MPSIVENLLKIYIEIFSSPDEKLWQNFVKKFNFMLSLMLINLNVMR